MSTVDASGDAFRGKVVEEASGKFEADSHIIKNVEAARSEYWVLRSKHLKRIVLYKEIEGLIQGNPPYSPSELRAAGLQHIANFNDMSARAVFERAALAYWNLLHNSEYLTRFVLRINSPQSTEWANIMAQHWDFAVRRHWPSFDINVSSLTSQLVKFGVSPLIFPNEKDPRWRMVELSKFFIPDQQQSDLDMLTTLCVETELTVQYLWGIYQEFKDEPEKASPWNLKELGRLLVWASATPQRDTLGPADLLELERKLIAGDYTFDRVYNDTVRMISLLQKEFDGTISHYMFHRDFESEDFVFKQHEQYGNMGEAILIFTMNPGEYTIHTNRGVGHKIFSLAQAKIQMDCSVVDAAKWASTPILKSPTLNTKDVEQIRFYPGVPTNIGGAEFVQNNLGANINNIVGAAQYISGLIQNNIAYSGGDPATPDPDKGSISPTQARLMAYREFSVLKNNIAHYYTTFDKLVQNMTAKMFFSKEGYPGHEIAKEWKERCIEDGVPPEIFEVKADSKQPWGMPKHIEVYATRVAGAGSQVAQLMGLQELQVISGSFGPREAREYKRQWIMAAMGPEYVEAFMQESDDVDERAGGASLAGVENAIMQAGKSPIFSPDNEHRAHFAIHMALAKQIADGISAQQFDIVEADSIFNVLVPHTGEHLQALEADVLSQAFVEQVKGSYGELVRFATLNRRNAAKQLQARAREQQQAQANQQQVMTEEQLKTMQVINDEKRKDIKLQAQAQRQQEAGDTKAELARTKTQQELQIKREKAKGEVEVQKMKAQFENTAVEDSQANPQAALANMRGETISPYDIEGS